jgi:hypothetical protein
VIATQPVHWRSWLPNSGCLSRLFRGRCLERNVVSEVFPLEISQRLIYLVVSVGTRVVMQEQQWEVLEHPPYSPDLVPSDFHLFGPLKHHLSAEHFPDDEAVEREVTAWF